MNFSSDFLNFIDLPAEDQIETKIFRFTNAHVANCSFNDGKLTRNLAQPVGNTDCVDIFAASTADTDFQCSKQR